MTTPMGGAGGPVALGPLTGLASNVPLGPLAGAGTVAVGPLSGVTGSVDVGPLSGVGGPVSIGPLAGVGGSIDMGPVALPRSGVGGLADNASINFLLLGSLISLTYVGIAFLIRKAMGRGPLLENDGIVGI